ncbi:MAG: hypothetical protein K9H25_02580 [Rhodospirillum sp.]|nr:hypothetical protein [Rhodospirillum sp.]MCF8488541.1 hypothetical protein [Rhodospirillum sp.]MCF8499137.1 hypothetical protein [Rhodospirillum sp.]
MNMNLNVTSGIAIGIAVVALGLATWAVTDTLRDRRDDVSLFGIVTVDPGDNSVTLTPPDVDK